MRADAKELKRALEEGFAALGDRVDAARREVTGALEERVRGLHDSQQETRDHVRSLSDRLAAHTDSQLPTLRKDVAALTDMVRGLHTELAAITARLPAPAETAKTDDGEQPASPPGRAVPPAPATEAGPAPTEAGTARQPSAPTAHPQGDPVSTDNTPDEQPPSEKDDRDQELKRAVEAAYLGTPADQPSPTVQAPAGKPRDPQVEHGVLLLRAAGVALAEVVAHRHTWEWLAACAAGHDHFRTPPAVEDLPDGRITTTVSGRSLIALLIVLWHTREAAGLDGDWALASTAYQRAATALNKVTGQGSTIRIVLDDGYAQDEQHDEDDEDGGDSQKNQGPAGWGR
ncbi:hypothetical protein [Streptomyces sp. cmx-10-25]|uniref:hypothetical protein n=1 Tax=Streptomyces sp. cmx-10-25 TaxID=2790919 RepID=UPI0039817A00